MDPLPTPQHAGPGHPLPNPSTAPANPASQFFFQPTNEQIMWLQQQQQQQQQQRLREQQAAIMQLFYAQQSRGFSSEGGIHGGNMMFSNPFPTAPMPYAYGFPPFLNGQSINSSFPLSNPSFQYPMTPSLHQPPFPFPPFSSPAMGLAKNDDSSTIGNQPSPSTVSSNSSTPVVDTSQSFSVSSSTATSTTGEFTAADDLILAKALHEHGMSSKKAISSLAGTRDHSGSEWQKYYASKRDIIDKIARDIYPSNNNIKPAREKNSRRHTRSLGIPAEEPIPSKMLVPQCGGNKYTAEDDEYFTQYVLWSFSQDVEASKPTVCQALCLKAPHHSLASWKTYWWSRDKDIERVRQLFKAGTPPNGVASFTVTHTRSQRGRPTRLASPLTQETRSWDIGSQGNKSDAVAAISSFESDSLTSDSNDTSEDDQPEENAKGRVSTNQNRIPYTNADLQAVVKSMAESPTLPWRTRWNTFSNHRPAHSSKAWGEYYRRNQAIIDRKARRLAKRLATENADSNDIAIVVEDTPVKESPPKTKSGMNLSTALSCLDEPVKQSQPPSASQDRLQLDVGLSQLQPPSSATPDLPHPLTKPVAVSESSRDSHPVASNLLAQNHAQPASLASGIDENQLQGCRLSHNSFHLSHFQPDDRHTVKQESSTSLSAARWPSTTQGSEIGSKAHASLNRPAISGPSPSSRPPIPDTSTRAAPSSSQRTSRATLRTLDPIMQLERELLAAVKRKAHEEVTEREDKRTRWEC